MRKQHFSRFGSHSHKSDCVPFRCGPFQKVVSVRLHRYRKKNQADRSKACPEIVRYEKVTRNPNNTQTYRSVLV